MCPLILTGYTVPSFDVFHDVYHYSQINYSQDVCAFNLHGLTLTNVLLYRLKCVIKGRVQPVIHEPAPAEPIVRHILLLLT